MNRQQSYQRRCLTCKMYWPEAPGQPGAGYKRAEDGVWETRRCRACVRSEVEFYASLGKDARAIGIS